MKKKNSKTENLPEEKSEPIIENLPENKSEPTGEKLVDNKGNVILETRIAELMHQRNITREEAIEIYRDPK